MSKASARRRPRDRWTNGTYLAVGTLAVAIATVAGPMISVMADGSDRKTNVSPSAPGVVANQQVTVAGFQSPTTTQTAASESESAARVSDELVPERHERSRTATAGRESANPRPVAQSDALTNPETLASTPRTSSDVPQSTSEQLPRVRSGDNYGVIANRVGQVTINNNPIRRDEDE